jgi:2-polyprenyl-3-methyl-5-hydroxy-6-metoxy-1,4-benzoquinol methylase
LKNEAFPDAAWLAREVGIPEQSLIEGFKIERAFHEAILKEREPSRRLGMYAEVYSRVHAIYRASIDDRAVLAAKLRMMSLFRKELSGCSILDVGCGGGHFLRCVADHMPHGALLGIDVDLGAVPDKTEGVEFFEANIIDFSLHGRYFEVVVSDNVVEHIAPADVALHLAALRRAVVAGGTLIMILPHRLFGPSDVTRILDNTRTNRVQAQGTHLNESTYAEMIRALASAGFNNFRTIIQLPKLTYRFGPLRIPPSLYLLVERCPWVMRLIHRVRWRGQTLFKFNVVLIADAI